LTDHPAQEYEARLGAHRTVAAQESRRAARISNARLAVFALAVGLCFAVFGSPGIRLLWLAPPLLVFLTLVVMHDRVLRAQKRAERAAAYYEAGLARLHYRLLDAGGSEADPGSPDHLYAADLDLFGPGSVFALISRARTKTGEARLASWLLDPAHPEEIRSRQGAVAELRGRLDLRERLALVGEEVAPRLHPERLVAWGASAGTGPRSAERVLAIALPTLSLTAAAAWALGAGPLPFVAGLFVQSGWAWRRRSRVRECIEGVERAGPDLDLLADLLEHLEGEEALTSDRLASLREAVRSQGLPPSRQIARLRRLRDLLDARRNQFFAPLGALLLFTTQIAFAIEAWRAACGPLLGRWVDAVADLEALSSLATQAFEHPDDPFPEILAETEPHFEAEGLGHPLLAEERCVRNDVQLSRELQVLVVSGSNMSGKSTLLRSVGTNAVLGLAGGTVRARRLVLSTLAVGASIRLHDSLLEGASRFYAEITRLRAITERTRGEIPVLFLLDEILHGTNSHDRRIGAEAVVRSLVAAGAVGLVTTHDLALAKVADALAPRAANVHFEDHLEEGRMSFDYRMRPGVVTRSNALALMRAVGLEVRDNSG
jgi:hypothetical protein